MHIGVNAHLIGADVGYRQAGVSVYIERLLTSMIEQAGGARWTIYAAPDVFRPQLPAAATVEWRRSRVPTSRPAVRILWEQCVSPARLALSRPDVLFCPLNVVPLLAPCPTVVTVHDLAFLRYDMHRPAKRRYLAFMTRASVRRAAHVITVSEFTRQEVIDLLGIDRRKITVVHNGREERFAPPDPQLLEKFRRQHRLPPRYLLFVGTLEPRKNLATLLRAYATVKERLGIPLLIGGGKGWWFDEVFKLVRQLGLEREVRFLGFVPSADLPLYYAGAEAVVYPSLYEGFGLPPLEAMSCGTPVIVSDAPALQEVVGDAAVVAPALNVQVLADAIVRITTDRVLRTTLRASGIKRAAQFLWRKAGKETLRVLSEVAVRPARQEPIPTAIVQYGI